MKRLFDRQPLRLGVYSCVAVLGMVSLLACRPSRDEPLKESSGPSDLPAAGQSPAAKKSPWFEDVTSRAGLAFRYERGPERYWLPEIMGGGAGWIDFDRDGHLDLYLVQGGNHLSQSAGGGPANVLYRNRGDGTFEDVTQQAGVGDTRYGMGVAVGDFDQDGYSDLYVTNVGANVLYRNRGDGTFEDVTQRAGVAAPGWSTAAAFVDYDQDGDTDLMVVNYIDWSPQREVSCKKGSNERDYCSPLVYQAPAMDTLFRNRGDGTFEDVTLEAGLQAAFGNGLGLIVSDLNLDGRIDFYVANDGMPNQLWLQDASGKFKDHALAMGCAVNRNGMAEAGMGVAAIDLENDSDMDLFVTHLTKETNTLFVNHGDYFADETAEYQLAAPSLNYTGFGAVFNDFNHDGCLDLYVVNGRVGKFGKAYRTDDPFAEPNLLFRGAADGKFVEQLPQGGTEPVLTENGRAAAAADYDRDGDVDLVIVNNGDRATLLANRAGDERAWLRLQVVDSLGREATGARVGVRTVRGWQWRLVGRSSSYLASHEMEVHFGLAGDERVEEVQVIWPNLQAESFGACDVRRSYLLRQGDAPARLTP